MTNFGCSSIGITTTWACFYTQIPKRFARGGYGGFVDVQHQSMVLCPAAMSMTRLDLSTSVYMCMYRVNGLGSGNWRYHIDWF